MKELLLKIKFWFVAEGYEDEDGFHYGKCPDVHLPDLETEESIQYILAIKHLNEILHGGVL